MKPNRLTQIIALVVIIFVTLLGEVPLSLGFSRDGSDFDRRDRNSGGHTLFVQSAVENADFSQVVLPLFKGTSRGRVVWYVVTESSDPSDAAARKVNSSPKLANAKGTKAVQKVQVINGLIDFPATVDFSPTRVVVPGPTGFPPSMALPGAVGEPDYSPLIELPNGIVLHASQVANASGQADKIVSIDTVNGKVTFRETTGFSFTLTVHYVSFDASDPVAAALEDVTYAPNLNFAPTAGEEGAGSAREGLIAFTNGQTGVNNPQRQGLSSAILDGLTPLNILHAWPGFDSYSPLWDIHLVSWTAAAVASGQNLRQDNFRPVLDLVQKGLITGFGGGPFGPSGFIVTCPVMSLDRS